MQTKGTTLDIPLSAIRPCAPLPSRREGLNPEDYPDINKFANPGDVAPYSREFNRLSGIVAKQARGDLDLKARYEQILEQVRQTKESTLQVDERRFDAPVDHVESTVKSASFGRLELNEYPGQSFTFSAVGSSMADLVADLLGQSNQMTRAQAARTADSKIQERDCYLSTALAGGTPVTLTVAKGAIANSQKIRAVVKAI